MRVFLETLGCKLNQAESEMILRDFLDKGIEQTDRLEEADIYVLNTCTVTGQADAKARKLLKGPRRLNPELNIVATWLLCRKRWWRSGITGRSTYP